jgi:hypothetical protein
MQYFDFFCRFGRFFFPAAIFFALTAILPATENTISSDFILQQSISSALLQRTIESDMRISVFVDGIEYAARGRYEEQVAPNVKPGNFLRSMYRLDVNFLSDTPAAPGSEPNRMTIVCHLSNDLEKNQIWQYTSVEGKKSLNIIKVSTLEAAIQHSQKTAVFGTLSGVKNLGGLSAQMKQLASFYEFTASPTAETIEGENPVKVWKLTGTVKKELFKTLIERFGGVEKKGAYPSDFPSDIELWIGQTDFFPYKIQYLNRPKENSEKRTVLYRASYYNVMLNGKEIPASQFAMLEKGEYPEGVFNFTDITQQVIRSLGLR